MEYNRGVFVTGKDGRYRFIGIEAGVLIQSPADGPGWPDARRPQDVIRTVRRTYIFMVTAPRFQKLVTHIFVGDDRYIDSDTAFGVKKTLIAPFEHVSDGKTIWRAPFDFVMTPEGIEARPA